MASAGKLDRGRYAEAVKKVSLGGRRIYREAVRDQ
jgi:hypothetical protein